MEIGSFAQAIAVLVNTPSTPNSIQIAASLAHPTPASTITGTFTLSLINAILYLFCTPKPLPIGAASGIIASAPASSSLFATIKSSLVYAITVKPSFFRISQAFIVSITSGYKVFVKSPIISSFIKSIPVASLINLNVVIVSSACQPVRCCPDRMLQEGGRNHYLCCAEHYYHDTTGAGKSHGRSE